MVRYIHLNPLRGKLIDGAEALDNYPYSGHSALMGNRPTDWQDTATVLGRFGSRKRTARIDYRAFLVKGIELERRPELTGGGLIRSLGGWDEIKAHRRQKEYMKGDERILGDSDYVDEILGAANERLQRTYQLKAMGLDVDKVAKRVAALLTLPVEAVWAVGKHRKTVAARSLLCYWSVRQLGLSMSSLARRLGISSTSISQSVLRGELIVNKRHYKLVK